MDVERKGTKIIIDLDKEEDAAGLWAVLAQQPTRVTPEAFTQGQFIYNWLYAAVLKLASNYQQESTIRSQSAETMTRQRKSRKQ